MPEGQQPHPIAGLDELDGCWLNAQSFAEQLGAALLEQRGSWSMLGEAKPGGSTTFRI